MLLKKRFVKLKNLCEQIRGVSYTPKDVRDTPAEGYLPVLRANNIQDKITLDDLVYVNHKKIGAEQLLKEGDILICASSGSKKIVGKAVMVHNLTIQPASFGAFCKIVRPTKIYAPYLAHFFNSSYYRNTISHTALGANINNIRNEHINNLDIPYPDQTEQKRIAERLDKVQELIALQKEQLKKLDDLIKSRFIDLFGNPITNPKGWPLYALHEIATLNPSRSNMPEHTLVSFIPMDAVSTDGYILYQKSGSYASFKKGFTPFIEGDILFAKITPCMENGKGCIATQLQNQVGFGSTEFHVVRPNSSVNTKFLSFILQSRFFRRIAARHMTGSAGQRRVPISFLETYKIALPPKSLQTQFADFVTKIDSQKGLLTTRLSHLETLYKSLMQEYFG